MKKILALVLTLALALGLTVSLGLAAAPPELEAFPIFAAAAEPAEVPMEPVEVTPAPDPAPVPETEPPNTDLTEIVTAVIGLLAALVTRYIVPILKQHNLEKWAHVAVYAAEKLLGPHVGPDKLNLAKKMLTEWGYNIDTLKVTAALEAAVQSLTLEQKKPPNSKLVD